MMGYNSQVTVQDLKVWRLISGDAHIDKSGSDAGKIMNHANAKLDEVNAKTRCGPILEIVEITGIHTFNVKFN